MSQISKKISHSSDSVPSQTERMVSTYSPFEKFMTLKNNRGKHFHGCYKCYPKVKGTKCFNRKCMLEADQPCDQHKPQEKI